MEKTDLIFPSPSTESLERTLPLLVNLRLRPLSRVSPRHVKK